MVLPTGPGGRLNLTQCQRLAASAEHAALVSCWRIDHTDLHQAGTADRQDMLAAAMCGPLLQICGTDAPWQLAPARLAAALHHQVVAIPGALDSPGTRGPHRLIAEGTAGLVTDASDPFGLGHEPAGALAGRASVVEADPGLDHDRRCGCGGRASTASTTPTERPERRATARPPRSASFGTRCGWFVRGRARSCTAATPNRPTFSTRSPIARHRGHGDGEPATCRRAELDCG
ncbi:hypothetical protein [Actinocatenispora comari]|uniref:hypothetical protein n=1 Tax=Actinocatenispora comari TaxID=2807577 RepID=UPI001A9390DC|nr:hypothetical protein [Actinocatenispora comari]